MIVRVKRPLSIFFSSYIRADSFSFFYLGLMIKTMGMRTMEMNGGQGRIQDFGKGSLPTYEVWRSPKGRGGGSLPPPPLDRPLSGTAEY